MKNLILFLTAFFSLPGFAEEADFRDALTGDAKIEQELVDEMCDAYTRMNESALVLAREERATKVSGVVNLKTNDYHGRRFTEAGEEMAKARKAYKAKFGEEILEKRCKWIHEVSDEDLKLVNAWVAKKFGVKDGKKGK